MQRYTKGQEAGRAELLGNAPAPAPSASVALTEKEKAEKNAAQTGDIVKSLSKSGAGGSVEAGAVQVV